jgi:hypothetical protein
MANEVVFKGMVKPVNCVRVEGRRQMRLVMNTVRRPPQLSRWAPVQPGTQDGKERLNLPVLAENYKPDLMAGSSWEAWPELIVFGKHVFSFDLGSPPDRRRSCSCLC